MPISRPAKSPTVYMKIYFAGSIRGGRDLSGLYKRIILHMEKKGTVLTEHVGREDVIQDEKNLTDDQIYLRDMSWIQECDILIAECTVPSLGVGFELCHAWHLGKPCHVLYDSGKTSLSAMISGNGHYIKHPYEHEEQLFEILDRILESE
mgnify:CR=1 FL=1